MSARQVAEQTFLLPDLGEGLTEAEVVRWLVAEGEHVRVDQPAVEVETAKAVVEVPTPFAGRVTRLHAAAGQTVDVGRPLLSVAVEEPPGLPQEASAAAYREEERAGSGNVLIGYGTGAAVAPRRHRRPRAVTLGAEAAPGAGSTGRPKVVSPLVRRLARQQGIDLTTIAGSGRGGLILRGDVEQAAVARPAESAARPVAPESPAPARELRTPLSAHRKAVSAALSRSRREIPEATIWVDVDATELMALRAAGPGPGLMAYLARFTVAALKEYPVLNSRLDTERSEIVQFGRINLGIAVQGERGLVVPAVLGAETLSTTALDAEIRRVVAAARAGKATVEELSAGTFTLNNYGGFRVDGSAAIINYPQVAILGIGRIIDRPWVVGGEMVIRKIAQMSFVFDHRVCDGGTAAGFVRRVADAVENPAAAIAYL